MLYFIAQPAHDKKVGRKRCDKTSEVGTQFEDDPQEVGEYRILTPTKYRKLDVDDYTPRSSDFDTEYTEQSTPRSEDGYSPIKADPLLNPKPETSEDEDSSDDDYFL